jgi:hypothetical protein
MQAVRGFVRYGGALQRLFGDLARPLQLRDIVGHHLFRTNVLDHVERNRDTASGRQLLLQAMVDSARSLIYTNVNESQSQYGWKALTSSKGSEAKPLPHIPSTHIRTASTK